MDINQSWFEMLDLRNKNLDNSVWIPLRSEKNIRNNIESGFYGHQEHFFGSGSLMIAKKDKAYSNQLDWMDIGIMPIHNSHYREGQYFPSDIFIGENNNFKGTNLILNQSFDNNYDNNEWHLHQDLVISLGLKREGDIWVCPQEGYVEVAKLERDKEGNPVVMLIKNQFLKDYLSARDSGLYVSSYYSRVYIYDKSDIVSWNEKSKEEKKGKDLWEYGIMEIHEGGFPFGQKIAISHAGRIDIFENEDIPDISKFPTNDNVKSEFYEKEFEGKKLFRIMAELWKYDWINPAKKSSIVLGQKDKTKIYFTIDAEGRKESGYNLRKGGKWLWFKPDLVSNLLTKRGSNLSWYTQDTGSIACGPNGAIHFGINQLGLITVYAKDIGYLPIWQQQIWAGFNISPEGGISKELHDSQVKAEPASTLAPEDFFSSVINDLNNEFTKQLGFKLFREHQSIKEILPSINRFRATDNKGLFSLAKDIARVIIDDINTEEIQKIAIPPKGTKWGSIKSLENLLSIKIKEEYARKILSPIVGVYELRHGDAHLPSSNTIESFKLVGVDNNSPHVIQGFQMLYACVDHLHMILAVIKKWK